MVAIAEGFFRRWEREREHRELVELEQLAVWLLTLLGTSTPGYGRVNQDDCPGST
jgi:hypothetical protein